MPRASSTGIRGLYRGPDGRYYIDLRWRDPKTGKPRRHQERFPPGAKTAAVRLRAQTILNGTLTGDFDPDRPAAATLGPALDRYVEHCETHGLRSAGDRRTHAKALREALGEKTELADLVAPAVERFKASMLATGRSPATINRHVQTLKHFAKWARTHAGMPAEVVRALREDVRQLAEPEGRKRYLTPDEEKTVHTKLGGWLRPIALACKYTGARLSEITNLRGRDVDRHAGVLRFTKTKTGRTREVAIVPELAAILDALPAREPDAFVFAVPRRQSRAENVKRTEEKRRRDVASKAWATFCEKNGLADLHAHDLRHHAATMIRRAGGGLDTVAKVLGHTNIRTAARYAHVEVEDTRRFLEAAAVRGVAFSMPNAQDPSSAETPKKTGRKPDRRK